MGKKVKTIIILLLLGMMLHGENKEKTIDDIITETINKESEKERKKREKEEKKLEQKIKAEEKKLEKQLEKEIKKQEKDKKNQQEERAIEDIIKDELTKSKTEEIRIQNQIIQSKIEKLKSEDLKNKNNEKVVNNTSSANSANNVIINKPNVEKTVEIKTKKEIEQILKKNKEKEEKTVEIDKNKPVILAEEREKVEKNDYKGSLMKYIGTKNGKVLKKENEKVKHPIASLTKVMNVLVTLDEIDKGNAKLEDKVCFSKENTNIGGSWLNTKEGECFILRDLLRVELIYSANNAAYLVAKHIGKGNIDTFVDLMNKMAKKIGMNDTTFYTPAGLPTNMTNKEMDISTAYDMYLLGKKALSDDRIREWASEEQFIAINSKGEQVVYNNRNKLLGSHGIYGLKTGFHNKAGYNIIVLSRLGNIEVISVTLGNVSEKSRIDDQLNEFSQLENQLKLIYEAGTSMGEFVIKNGKKDRVEGILSDDIYELAGENYTYIIKDLEIKLGKEGLKEGDKIGVLEVMEDGKKVGEIDILSIENIQKISFWEKIWNFIQKLFFGNKK